MEARLIQPDYSMQLFAIFMPALDELGKKVQTCILTRRLYGWTSANECEETQTDLRWICKCHQMRFLFPRESWIQSLFQVQMESDFMNETGDCYNYKFGISILRNLKVNGIPNTNGEYWK